MGCNDPPKREEKKFNKENNTSTEDGLFDWCSGKDPHFTEPINTRHPEENCKYTTISQASQNVEKRRIGFGGIVRGSIIRILSAGLLRTRHQALIKTVFGTERH